jgi:hypothetical protein
VYPNPPATLDDLKGGSGAEKQPHKSGRQANFPNSADPDGMKQSEYDGTLRSGRALLLDTFLPL